MTEKLMEKIYKGINKTVDDSIELMDKNYLLYVLCEIGYVAMLILFGYIIDYLKKQFK